MDFNNSQTHAQNRPQPEPFVPSGGKKKSRAKFPRINNLTSAALVLIAIILLVFGLLWYFRGGFSEGSYINKSEYQAVFLSNGQVYFGKLDKLTSQYAELTDIYYLQVQQTVQPNQNSSSSQPQNVQLVKLGNELHGPEDAMQINRDQVVFWENLKPSGKVSQAIAQYQKNGDKGTPSTTTSTTPSTTNTPSSTNNSTSNSNESTSTSTTPSSSTTGNTSTTPETTKP